MTYYVSMTDKFMSGWGRADGLRNVLLLECRDYDEARALEQWVKNNRAEMRRVNISERPALLRKTWGSEYELNGALVQIKTRDDMPMWFRASSKDANKLRAKELLCESEDALMNPHAYTGQACGCGDCFCCAALEVAQERGIDLETWEPAA